MIYIDGYDKEILDAIRKKPGVTLRDLQLEVGRQSTPFRKKLKRLTELGLIMVKEIPAIETISSYRLVNHPRKTFYLNKRMLKEIVRVSNDRRN